MGRVGRRVGRMLEYRETEEDDEQENGEEESGGR